MSAIEFCRERILEVPLEVFEVWFKLKHPEAFRARNVNTTLDSKNTIETKQKN